MLRKSEKAPATSRQARRGNARLLLAAGTILLAAAALAGLAWLHGRSTRRAIVFVYREAGGSSLAGIRLPGGAWQTLARTGSPAGWVGAQVEALTGLQAPAALKEIPGGTFLAPQWLSEAGLLAFRVSIPGQGCEQVLILDTAGGDPQEIACLGGDIPTEAFDWSPDGRLYAFAARSGAGRLLRIAEASGRVVSSVKLPGKVWGLAWSPDSARLALTVEDDRSLLILETDGSQLWLQPDGPASGRPTWSPDGRQLAFLCGFAGQIDFCLADSGGGWKSRIEFGPDVPYIKRSPIWSPRGDWLLFEAVQDGRFNELYLVSPDGRNVRRLTFDPLGDSEPAWSPDGGRIAFVSMRDGNREIYMISTDGTGLTRLTHTPGDEFSPAWLPEN